MIADAIGRCIRLCFDSEALVRMQFSGTHVLATCLKGLLPDDDMPNVSGTIYDTLKLRSV